VIEHQHFAGNSVIRSSARISPKMRVACNSLINKALRLDGDQSSGQKPEAQAMPGVRTFSIINLIAVMTSSDDREFGRDAFISPTVIRHVIF
jgi:hypothetical protein